VRKILFVFVSVLCVFILLTSLVCATPVTFSNIEVVAIKDNSVTIRWDTDIAATGQVEYGLGTGYGSLTDEDGLSYWQQIEVTGLTEGTGYHFRIKAVDYEGNETISGDSVFTTRTQIELDSIVIEVRTNHDLPKVYYVKTDGNDSYNGLSIDSAWATLSYATQLLEAGDTLYILDGTWYNEHCVISNSGIANDPIVVKSYTEMPIMQCTNPQANIDIGFKIYEKSYITIDGITMRHYWRHFDITKSSHINILNCSIYTENPSISTSGITIGDGSYNSLIENCLIDGDAWNSITICGRSYGVNGPYWSYGESYDIIIKNCVFRNNTLHGFVDYFGIIHHINIENNTFYNGLGGGYSHQGHPHNLNIINNTVYNCSTGFYLDAGTSYSLFDNNTIYNLNPSNGHCIHIRTNITFGDTTFNSTDNVIRNNYFRGDVYYNMVIVDGINSFLDSNDVHSDYGDAEYRIGSDSLCNGIICNAIGKTYNIISAYGTKVNVEYTDGKVFTEDKNGEPWYYTNRSKYIVPINENVMISTYLMSVVPSTDSLEVSIITWDTTGTYYKKWQEICESPTVVTSHTVGDLHPNSIIEVKVNSVTYDTFTADTVGWIAFDYTGGFSQDTVIFEAEVISSAVKEITANHKPSIYSLSQNFPNPFRSRTEIMYSLPAGGDVELNIYNILGQKVRALVNGHRNSGYYRILWDGKDANNQSVSGGIYFYRLIADNYKVEKKMILIR